MKIGMQMKMGAARDPFEWTLIAKGIGIFFVVVGHFDPENSPIYWSGIKGIIYSFHMPLFFILSGYLYSHGKYSYSELIKAKVKRLLYPFASIAVTFLLIKYVVGQFFSLKYPVDIDNIYALLTDPINSYMPLLWFMHALFLIFVLFPLARLFLNNISILLCLLVINTALGNDYLVLGKALAYMPFFVVGVIFKEHEKISRMTISNDWRYVFVPLVMFVIAYAIQLFVHFMPVYRYPTQFFFGFVGSMVIINISHTISALSDTRIKGMLLQIGYYSMSIYLFHTLFESAVRIGFLQAFKNIQVPFELIAVIAITCGVVFPLVLEKEILRNNWVTKKFVLGLA
jgi:fucose 4-O-acetylase-like acetyltransferase